MERIIAIAQNLDFKSLIIGLLIGVCALLVSGQYDHNENTDGRFMCCAAGSDPYGVFIVDTQTGQTWRLDNKSTIYYGAPENRQSSRSYDPSER